MVDVGTGVVRVVSLTVGRSPQGPPDVGPEE